MKKGIVKILTKPEEQHVQVDWAVYFLYEGEKYALWSSSSSSGHHEYIIYRNPKHLEALGTEVDADDPKFDKLYEYIHSNAEEFKHYSLNPGQEFIIN